MTTSRTASFLSDVLRGGEIALGTIAYFRERLRNRLHEMVLEEFIRQQEEAGLTKAELARRIRRAPEQVTRWLGAPGNWTIDTASDLLLGMGAEPGDLVAAPLADRAPRNYTQPDWLGTPAGSGQPNQFTISNSEHNETRTAASSRGSSFLLTNERRG